MASMTKSRRLRGIVAVAAVAAVAATLTACGDTGTSPESTSSATAQPKQGGTVTIISASSVNSWDPISAVNPTIPGIATDGLLAVYGALLYVDAKGAVQPLMASSMSSTDFIHWTLKLRDGIKFTDGTAYDATAVKYNWDRAAGASSALKGIASTITSTVKDATELDITLSAANPVFDRQVAEQLSFIASPTSLKAVTDKYTKPVGAGPFILDSWDTATGEKFSRNPNYFESGKPYLDHLNLKVVSDPAQRVTTVQQGGGDIMNNYKFAILDVIGDSCCSSYGVASGGLRMFIFNNQTAPFNDVRARQAATLAIDPTALTQTLTQDPSESGWSGLFAKSSDLYNSQYDLKENKADQAKQLVGQLKAAGVKTSIKVLVASVPELVRASELLQIQLQAAGFTVQLQQIALNDWANAARVNHDFDITFYPGIYDLNNAPISMTNLFEGSENIAQYKSADMSAALKAAREAKPGADQVTAFAKVQSIFQQDVPFAVFGIDQRLFFYHKGVAGFTPIGRGMLLTEDLYRTDLG